MPVEFLGIAATNDGSEITARSGASFDKDYTLRLARAHEENGWDRVLFAYGSGSPDPNVGATYTPPGPTPGVDIISMRGYDLLTDATEIGQQVIPIVREEVAKRDAAAAVA